MSGWRLRTAGVSPGSPCQSRRFPRQLLPLPCGQRVPTATTTPARGAPTEPQVMTPTEEQTARRAALLKRRAALPEHLRLGVTLPGMRELRSQLPSDAVEQVNAKIPRGGPRAAGPLGPL
eukprot:scaffold19911_cov59-Phaeocystis_antarctica.AAC.2